MTPDRRHRNLTVVGDRITDEDAMRSWLASMAPPPRVKVERLSLSDPAFQEKGRPRRKAA